MMNLFEKLSKEDKKLFNEIWSSYREALKYKGEKPAKISVNKHMFTTPYAVLSQYFKLELNGLLEKEQYKLHYSNDMLQVNEDHLLDSKSFIWMSDINGYEAGYPELPVASVYQTVANGSLLLINTSFPLDNGALEVLSVSTEEGEEYFSKDSSFVLEQSFIELLHDKSGCFVVDEVFEEKLDGVEYLLVPFKEFDNIFVATEKNSEKTYSIEDILSSVEKCIVAVDLEMKEFYKKLSYN